MYVEHDAAFYLAAILDASNDAIIGQNLDGVITSWNPAAERMFGYTAEEAIGQSIALIIPTHRLRDEELVLARVRAGIQGESHEAPRRRNDERLIDVSSTIVPIHDGHRVVIGVVTIAREVTEPQRRLVRELEQVSRLKDEFLATLSHELRTPLNAVMGYARLLRAGGLGERGREHALDLIDRNARLLSRLVSDMLDISTILTGQMQLTMGPCDIVQVVRAAVDDVRAMAGAKRVDIVQVVEQAPLFVLGDADRLRQVFVNLLSNAVKFTLDKGRIEVGMGKTPSGIRVTMTDTGIGIDPEFLPHLFERFRQADGGPRRRFGGLGLGLALARHLVRLHGGHVSASSGGPGHGSTFQVTLPPLGEPNALDGLTR